MVGEDWRQKIKNRDNVVMNYVVTNYCPTKIK